MCLERSVERSEAKNSRREYCLLLWTSFLELFQEESSCLSVFCNIFSGNTYILFSSYFHDLRGFFYFKFELLPSSNLMFWPVEIFAIFVLMLAIFFFLYISSGKISWQKSEIFIVIRSRLILTFDTLTLFFFWAQALFLVTLFILTKWVRKNRQFCSNSLSDPFQTT